MALKEDDLPPSAVTEQIATEQLELDRDGMIGPQFVSIFEPEPPPSPPQLAPELVAFILPKRGVTPEEQDAFSDMFAKLSRSLRPGNIIEQLELARITSLFWDCSCVDRYLNLILRNAREDSLRQLLKGRVDDLDAMVKGVRSGDQAAIALAQETLLKFGLSEEDVHAQSFLTHFETIERMKRLQIAATRELNQLFRDLDYRKKVRELARLRQLRESFEMQHFQKFGFDPKIKVPK